MGQKCKCTHPFFLISPFLSFFCIFGFAVFSDCDFKYFYFISIFFTRFSFSLIFFGHFVHIFFAFTLFSSLCELFFLFHNKIFYSTNGCISLFGKMQAELSAKFSMRKYKNTCGFFVDMHLRIRSAFAWDELHHKTQFWRHFLFAFFLIY